jgi:hypothetical protein
MSGGVLYRLWHCLVLCTLLLCRGGVSGRVSDGVSERVSEGVRGCGDWASCLRLHLRSPGLQRALDLRCSLRCYRNKQVLFTHIPKTG